MKKAIAMSVVIFLFAGLIHGQEKILLNVGDLNANINEYITKNYPGFKPVEAYRYDLCYEMKLVKGETNESLLFDGDGKFLNKKGGPEAGKVLLQTKSFIPPEKVSSVITDYIKMNFADYKLSEAYLCDASYTVKIAKEDVNATLLFDKDGRFQMKVSRPMKEEPKKADTTK
jgi:hypothetical protein